MKDFARSVGVPQSTFSRWISQHTEHEPAPAFIELTTVDLPQTVPSSFPLRLTSDRGIEVRLVFDAPPPAAWLGQVLREVLAC